MRNEGLFGRLSVEDHDVSIETSTMDIVEVLAIEEATLEANELVQTINADIAAMDQASLAAEHLESQIISAESALEDPASVTDKLVKLSYESLSQTADMLGISLEDAVGSVPSVEAISANPQSGMQLSVEGMKDFFKKIVDGIKKIFKKIGLSIKKLYVKLVVMVEGTEKGAIALKKKLKESKASGGEDINESDKSTIAKVKAGVLVLDEENNTPTIAAGDSSNTMKEFMDGLQAMLSDKGQRGKSFSADKIEEFFKKAGSLSDDQLKDLGLDNENGTDKYVFIPVRWDGAKISGAKVTIVEGKGNDKATVKFSTFSAKVSPSKIDDLSNDIKQLSNDEIQNQCDTLKTVAGKSKGFMNKTISFIDNFDKELDKVLKEAKGGDTDAQKGKKEHLKAVIGGIKLGGTSMVLDSVLNYVYVGKNSLKELKIQAKKYL